MIEDDMEKALAHGQKLFFEELEPSLMAQHLGKWVVVRRDTGAYTLHEAEEEAEMAALEIMEMFPDGSKYQVMGAQWFQVGARPTQYRQPPN